MATLHTINDAILKLSKIERADLLYRGVGGSPTPADLEANKLVVEALTTYYAILALTLTLPLTLHYRNATARRLSRRPRQVRLGLGVGVGLGQGQG